jgi:hypothetical protein
MLRTSTARTANKLARSLSKENLLDNLDMLAKKLTIEDLSKRTGVPIQYLVNFDHPLKAEGAAIALMPFVGKDSEKEPEPQVQCVKCGTTIKPMVKAWVRGSLSGAVKEHLDVECCICKYTWQKPTWEQEQKAKAPTKLPEDAKTLTAKKFRDMLDQLNKEVMTKPPKPNIFEQAVGINPGPRLTLWNDPIMTGKNTPFTPMKSASLDDEDDCCCCEDTECPSNPGFTGK